MSNITFFFVALYNEYLTEYRIQANRFLMNPVFYFSFAPSIFASFSPNNFIIYSPLFSSNPCYLILLIIFTSVMHLFSTYFSAGVPIKLGGGFIISYSPRTIAITVNNS